MTFQSHTFTNIDLVADALMGSCDSSVPFYYFFSLPPLIGLINYFHVDGWSL